MVRVYKISSFENSSFNDNVQISPKCEEISIQAILPVEKKEYFRRLWFDYSNTIGVRERNQSRWILLRRRGECLTNFGNIKVKQTLKPDGSINMKPENDEVLRLNLKHKKSTF